MKSTLRITTKASTGLEVLVVFALTLALVAAVGVSPLGEWGRRVGGHPYLEYAPMIGLPLIVLAGCRRSLAAHGISLHRPRYQLDVVLAALVPFAVAAVPFAFLDPRQWGHALLLAGVRVALLCSLGPLLRRKPTLGEGGVLPSLLLIALVPGLAFETGLRHALSALVFYVLFLGLGEELLFRGYIQSRLNHAWGRPFRFFGVPWGWGVVVAAAFFGWMHVLNLGSLTAGNWQPSWPWGCWTFFSGLVFGFLREKTGSIFAPALLHGLPQAIAHAALGR
jgi:uncharacterized protein